MNDGMIEPGQAPKSWGFTYDRFQGGSYLWKNGNAVTVSFIHAWETGKGHFSALVKAIEADGFTVQVPTPLGKMRAILARWGFGPSVIEDEQLGPVEVWKRKVSV